MKEAVVFRKTDILRLAAICLFAGSVTGTVWANGMGAELREQIGAYTQVCISGEYLGELGTEMLAEVFLRRALAAAAGWLIGMTLLARPAICVLAAGTGFSMAFLISCMTVQWGAGGLPVFVASLLPQWLLYVPVAAVLLSWAMAGQEKTHLPGFAVLLLLLFAGSVTELWFNPVVLQAIISICGI